ncbi:hypothetical protein FS837_002275 [Tulasnella sp. UAMH 9824]|nr:hypothetical protein FS837_002275 [Tulasnella sp. UAMH 9824]
MNVEDSLKHLLNDHQAVEALKALGTAASVVALYKLAGYILRELVLVPKLTILRDVEDLRKPRKGGKIPGRAVVCGGRLAVMRVRLRYGGIYSKDPHHDADDKRGLTLGITREAAETLIRKSLRLSRPNVTFKTGTVTRLIREGNRLGGVAVRTEAGEVEERADFVVDLRVEYNAGIRYGTAVWTLPDHVRAKWPVPGGYELGIILNMTPDAETGDSRGFYLSNMERNQTLITTGGWNGAGSPHSAAELRTYVKSLYGQENLPDWAWTLLDFLEEHEEECSPFHAEAKVGPLNWIQWHQAKSLPPNFVAIGDAIMKLNPVYGQGVTKACIDVTTLDAVLRRIPSTLPLPNVSKSFFKREVPRVQGLWDGTKANDYGFSTTVPAEGEDLSHGAFMRNWGRDVLILGHEDPATHSAWWDVNMMIAPGTDLFSPRVVVKMMRRKWLGW